MAGTIVACVAVVAPVYGAHRKLSDYPICESETQDQSGCLREVEGPLFGDWSVDGWVGRDWQVIDANGQIFRGRFFTADSARLRPLMGEVVHGYLLGGEAAFLAVDGTRIYPVTRSWAYLLWEELCVIAFLGLAVVFGCIGFYPPGHITSMGIPETRAGQWATLGMAIALPTAAWAATALVVPDWAVALGAPWSLAFTLAAFTAIPGHVHQYFGDKRPLVRGLLAASFIPMSWAAGTGLIVHGYVQHDAFRATQTSATCDETNYSEPCLRYATGRLGPCEDRGGGRSSRYETCYFNYLSDRQAWGQFASDRRTELQGAEGTIVHAFVVKDRLYSVFVGQDQIPAYERSQGLWTTFFGLTALGAGIWLLWPLARWLQTVHRGPPSRAPG